MAFTGFVFQGEISRVFILMATLRLSSGKVSLPKETLIYCTWHFKYIFKWIKIVYACACTFNGKRKCGCILYIYMYIIHVQGF